LCRNSDWGADLGGESARRGSCTQVRQSNLLIHELFRPFSENFSPQLAASFNRHFAGLPSLARCTDVISQGRQHGPDQVCERRCAGAAKAARKGLASSGTMRGEGAGSRRRIFRGHSVFPTRSSECLAIHSAACFSVAKPLTTSVSPSGQRTSTTQPNPGFFRGTKVGRCSDILRICACAGPVQASHPATIKLTHYQARGEVRAPCQTS
jgi:hypothetical protein